MHKLIKLRGILKKKNKTKGKGVVKEIIKSQLLIYFCVSDLFLPFSPWLVPHPHVHKKKNIHAHSLSPFLRSLKCPFLPYTSHKGNSHSLHTFSSLSLSLFLQLLPQIDQTPSGKKTRRPHLKI